MYSDNSLQKISSSDESDVLQYDRNCTVCHSFLSIIADWTSKIWRCVVGWDLKRRWGTCILDWVYRAARWDLISPVALWCWLKIEGACEHFLEHLPFNFTNMANQVSRKISGEHSNSLDVQSQPPSNSSKHLPPSFLPPAGGLITFALQQSENVCA